MEIREKTKYVLWLSGATPIGLEHGRKNLMTMTTNPLRKVPVGEESEE